jgi:DNA-binding XRE family transcriptional regulator
MGALAMIAEERLGKSTLAKRRKLRNRLEKIDAAATGRAGSRRTQEYTKHVAAIDELLFEYARETDPDERKNILRTLEEIVEDEPVALPTQTIEEWGEQVSAGDERRAGARLRDGREIQPFLKRYFSLRAKLGMRTQADVAKKAGLSRTHVASLESGNHYPQQKTLQKLAKAFRVDVTDLM